MSRRSRLQRALAAAASGALIITVATASAWACVPYPYVFVEPRASAPAGTEVTVSGSGFGADSLEVRWRAIDGALLVKAAGPTFSVPVIVPDEPPGLYTLLVVSRGRGGEVLGATPTVFDVTGPTRADATIPPTPTTAPATAPSSIARIDPLGATALGAALFGAGVAAGVLARRRPRAAPSAD